MNAEDRRGAVSFRSNELRYEYPERSCPLGATATSHLRALDRSRCSDRFPGRRASQRCARRSKRSSRWLPS